MTASWGDLFDRSQAYEIDLDAIRETCDELEEEGNG